MHFSVTSSHFSWQLRTFWYALFWLLVIGVVSDILFPVWQQRELASPSVWDRVMGGVPATGLVRMLLWCGAAAMIITSGATTRAGRVMSEVL